MGRSRGGLTTKIHTVVDASGLLIDREIAVRRSRALRRRLKKAQLHHEDACFEDIILIIGPTDPSS